MSDEFGGRTDGGIHRAIESRRMDRLYDRGRFESPCRSSGDNVVYDRAKGRKVNW